MNQPCILLVEDNADHEELALLALKQNNIANDVVVARNGVEALDYLFGRGQHAGRDVRIVPAVVLLDLKLPKIDGLEVLQEIRSNKLTELLPVVVLTSSDEETDVVRSYELHANSYIRKPVKFQDFVSATRQLGLYWLVLNEAPPRGRTGNEQAIAHS